MTTKEFKDTTKETIALIKKLSDEVPETSNAAEYSKFLQKTLKNARTFDKSSSEYKDYVAESMKVKDKKKDKESDSVTVSSDSVVVVDKGKKETKKRTKSDTIVDNKDTEKVTKP